MLLLLAVGLAVFGQTQLRQREASAQADGIVLAILAGVLFAAAWLLAAPKPEVAAGSQPASLAAVWGWVRAHTWRVLLGFASVVATVRLLATLGGRQELSDFTGPVLLWILSIALVTVAFGVSDRARVALVQINLSEWWTAHGRTALALGAIMLLAFGLRFWNVDGIPPTMGGDEGSQGLEALKVLSGEMRNPFTTGWLGVPTLSFFFQAPTIAWFGNTAFGLRLPWVLVGTLTVPITFWLVARFWGTSVGLMAAALLATYHFHLHFSRLGSNQIMDPLFVGLALLLIYRGFTRNSPISWALAGLTVGMAQYFYAGSRLTAVMAALVLAWLAVRDGGRLWREQKAGVAALVAVALTTAAPIIQYSLQFPDAYNARVNAVGLYQSGLMERYMAERNQTEIQVLLDQFQKAALAFNAIPDRTFWYGSPEPLLDPAAGALFLLGLGMATLGFWDQRLFPFAAWYWVALVLGGVLTENPPSAQRLTSLAVPAMVFVALALYWIGLLGQRVFRKWNPAALTPYLAAAVVGLSLSSVYFYFATYTPLRVYGNPTAVVATSLAYYARDSLGPEWRVYFFGAPQMYFDFGTIPYLAQDVEGQDIREPLRGVPSADFVPRDKHAAFVFLPGRRAELDLVRQRYPGGELVDVASPIRGSERLYTVYKVPMNGEAGGS